MFSERLKQKLQERKNSKHISILEAIWLQKAMNRRDIGKELNLSKGTMTKRINNLIDNGYVLENGSDANRGMGRNPENLKLCDNIFYSIGLHISEANKLKATAIDANSNTIASATHYVEENCVGMDRVELIADFMQKFIDSLEMDDENLVGIGIALTGISDWERGIVSCSSSLPELKDFHLKEYINDTFNCECEMINVSHLSVLNEKKWGKASEINNFVTLGQGLGAGLYVNGSLFRGWQGYAGEFGRMQIKETGDISVDGRKGVISSNAAIYRAKHAIERLHKTGDLQDIKKYYDNDKNEITDESIIKAVCEGDSLCCAIFRENFEWIAKGLLNLAYLLNPQVIFLPHWTAGCPDCTIKVVEDELSKYGAPNSHLQIEVDSARCDESFYPSGVAYYLVECMFERLRTP